MRSARERFDAKTKPGPGSCRDWTGGTTRGYGQFWDGTKVVPAPRWIWEQEHGPIPDGLTIDHTCLRPICVNPDHFELVTRGENARRGVASRYREACKAGHPWTEASTVQRKGGRRECRTCANDRQNRRRADPTVKAARAETERKRWHDRRANRGN